MASDRRELILRETLRRLEFQEPFAGAASNARLRDLGYVSPAEIMELKRQIVAIVRHMVGPNVKQFAENLELFPNDTVLRTRETIVHAFGRLPGSILPPPDEILKERTEDVDVAELAGDPIYPPDDEEKDR